MNPRSMYDLEIAYLEHGYPPEVATLGQPTDWSDPAETHGGWGERHDEEIPASQVPGADFTWPKAVPIRPARWNEATRSYQVDWGDTFSGLAATYLGDHMRWREIWNEQPGAYRASHNPDVLGVGEWLRMPADAYATLLAATGRGSEIPEGATPAQVPPGGYTTAGPGAPGTVKKKKAWPWIVGGAAAGVAGLVALASMG